MNLENVWFSAICALNGEVGRLPTTLKRKCDSVSLLSKYIAFVLSVKVVWNRHKSMRLVHTICARTFGGTICVVQ